MLITTEALAAQAPVSQIIFCRRDVHLLACLATIRVRRSMQRLMDVAYQMEQKREVASGAPLIVVTIASATSVLINFPRDTIPLWAPGGQIFLTILQADVDVMPGRRRAIFFPKLGVWPNRRSHRNLFRPNACCQPRLKFFATCDRWLASDCQLL
jgi:hypothetical protein